MDVEMGELNLDGVVARVQNWYGRHFHLRLGTPDFYRFAVRSWELARQVEKRVKLMVDERAPAAYCKKSSWAVLPLVYLTPVFYQELGIPPSAWDAAAIACVNGSQIHEAYHLRLTPGPDWGTMTKLDEKARHYLKTDPSLFSPILNVVEDLFIEAWGRQEYPQLAEFVTAKNQVLFNDYLVAKAFSEMRSTPSAHQLVSILGSLKREELWGDARYAPWEPFTALLREALQPGLNAAQRLKVAVMIYEKLWSSDAVDAEGNSLPRLTKSPGEDYGGERDSTEDETPGNQDSPESRVAHQIKRAIENGELSAVLRATRMGVERARADLKEGKESIEKYDGFVPKIKLVDVLEANERMLSLYYSEDLIDCPEFKGVGELLRYQRATKHVPGQPRTVGTNLLESRLAQIVIDQKILTYPDASRLQRGRPEIILLVDLSGSMNGRDRGRPLAQWVLSGAYEVFLSLRQARVSCAVYGHTSSSFENKLTPVIYGIAAAGLPFLSSPTAVSHGNFHARFRRALSLSREENFDGYAIECCASQFTTQPGSKYLLVLSDGLPSGGAVYGGESAISHTRAMIKSARQRGVHVISLSLIESVTSRNDQLYGEEFNLAAYGNLLIPALRALTQKLALTRA